MISLRADENDRVAVQTRASSLIFLSAPERARDTTTARPTVASVVAPGRVCEDCAVSFLKHMPQLPVFAPFTTLHAYGCFKLLNAPFPFPRWMGV
jgi:hypothetical protein